MPKKTTKKIIDEVNEHVAKEAESFPAPEPVSNEGHIIEITLAKFKKLFKDEIKETADWLWREDKEGDYPDKATCKKAAISFVINNHEEYHVTDRDDS